MGSTGQATGKALDGGKFDFHDGGTYCGSWEDGKAHGHGVCTGPKGQGVYTGSWHYGFEVSGVYTWPSGSSYEGQWQNGKRHGLGVETRGRWVYRGEWTQGFKGRYGVRQSTTSPAKYEGTWANGLQDGYGSETYADTGTYKGQWLRGLRHGYGVRTSAQFGQASVNRDKNNPIGSSTSLRSDGAGDPLADRDRKVDGGRGGFVLRARSDEMRGRRGSLVEKSNIKNVIKRIRRQKSTGDINSGRASGSIRSTGSSISGRSIDSGHSAYTTGDVPDEGSNASFVIEDEQLDASVVERYNGEWKNDKRAGFGVSERSDGLKYEGEWYNNKKYGYGVTTFKDGSREEGKYKNNVLITSNKKKHLFLIRSAKFRERIEAAVAAAQRAAKIAIQKEDIAITRTATGRGKGEQADIAAAHAREDAEIARAYAKQFAPDFQQPGIEPLKWKPSESPLPSSANPKLDENYGEDETYSSSPGGPGYTQPSLGGPQDMITDEGGGMTRKSSLAQGSAGDLTRNYGNAVDPRSKGGHRSRNQGAAPIPSSIMDDRFDHYNKPPSRPPSRDRSVDRLASRGQTPVPQELINSRSRAPSAQRSPPTPDWTPDSGVFDEEIQPPPLAAGGSRRSSKPSLLSGEAISLTGNGPVTPNLPYHIPANQREAESFLRQRACGQEITPSITPMGSVKRTESLYINPVIRRQAQTKQDAAPPAVALKRKKSLPEAQPLPLNTPLMSREEASVLSSHQRETVRRNFEETERYRSNPLLYLTSPTVQDWFSRQRLVLLILVLNFSMALVFLKLLS